MKVVLKGIESGEDAALAVTERVLMGSSSPIMVAAPLRAVAPHSNPCQEVVQGVGGRISGTRRWRHVRRGTDALKALALGASAPWASGVPYAWGPRGVWPGRCRARPRPSSILWNYYAGHWSAVVRAPCARSPRPRSSTPDASRVDRARVVRIMNLLESCWRPCTIWPPSRWSRCWRSSW